MGLRQAYVEVAAKSTQILGSYFVEPTATDIGVNCPSQP